MIYLAFVQHDEIKEEIVKENYFEFLIQCSTQKDLRIGLVLQLSLEIIWTITFNNKYTSNILMNNHEHFVMYLKTVLVNSNEQGVQATAK